ncbi:MAG: S9 family peptidase [Rubrivivax sp.]|nr:S9 family peptidase [Rubrivivax sp.]
MTTRPQRRPAAAPRLDVDALWQLERVGSIALSPDGRLACATLTRASMEHNRTTSALWLFATDRRAPRRLTLCGDKDGQPAFSPRGERIAFVARREQEGARDATPQLYLIDADGGEARRASRFAPGVESFKWLADGRRIVFAAWVWPEEKGPRAQSRRHARHAARKESGYATGQAFYRHWDRNLPEGRVLHLLLLDLASGRVRDLFEGTRLELPRDSEGNAGYDVHPSGARIAFVHDPGARQVPGNRCALAEIDLATRAVRTLADDPQWDFGAPRYAPDGRTLAATAAQVGVRHTALAQLALVEPQRGWRLAGAWDRDVAAPLHWTEDGRSVCFAAQDRGRRPLWRQDLADGAVTLLHEGGWVQSFALAADLLLLAVDSARHPVQLWARRAGRAAQRLERFNDAPLARLALGETREHEVRGARGEAVQFWVTRPPGFDARRRHAVVHVIHGGPHAAAGDTWSWRWNPQVLAAADRPGGPGRVVVQVNYHGSSGFGFAWRDSIVGRQGELELQDIEAVSDWLLARPWVDARRLYAAGGSYGGFLVAWMNGHVPGGEHRRYRAYLCHAGVFDRIATFAADSYAQRPKDLGARYWEDLPRVLAQSPMAFAAQMTTPTLVVHGALDYRVPDCNGLAYYNTLLARGVDTRLLWFGDENHWILKPRNSRQWYREFLAWIERHEPAGRAARAR